MKKLEFSQMENLQGGTDPSCERVVGWMAGFGGVLCCSGGLAPLGIVFLGCAALSALTCP